MAQLDLADIRLHAQHASPGDLEDDVMRLCVEVERLRAQLAGDLPCEAVRTQQEILDLCGDAEFEALYADAPGVCRLTANIRRAIRG